MAYSYQYIDHTADMGVEITADSLDELFSGGGEIFCDLICDRQSIGGGVQKNLVIYKSTQDEKFHGLLNELLYLFDTDHFLFSSVRIKEMSPDRLVVALRGEKVDPERHEIKAGVKAVTYHQLKVWEENGKWKGRVIFDV